MGVFDEDPAGGFDALDAPAGVAEEDDVAGRVSTAKCSSRVAIWTFSGWSMTAKMAVSGMAPPLAMAMHACAAAGVELALDAVAEEVGAVAAAGALDAVVEQGEELVEVRAA